jgi:hypothetical protein
MKHTHQPPSLGLMDPVHLDDAVWTVLHIAMFLGIKPTAVLSVVNSNGFPVPLTNQKRDRRWLAEDVKHFFAMKSKGAYEQKESSLINPSYSPKSIQIKKTRNS